MAANRFHNGRPMLLDAAPISHDDLLWIFGDQLKMVAEIQSIAEGIDLAKADKETCERYRALRRLYVQNAISLIETIEESGATLRERLNMLLLDS